MTIPERPRIPRNAVVLAFVALASGFGQDLITPVLPAYLAMIGIGSAGIGLIDGLVQGSVNLFRLVSGVLSDRLRDRKRLVFFGYALSSVARPLLAMTGAFAGVAAARVADGVGKGMKDAPRDALVAEAAAIGASGRAFGFHRLVDTAGSVLGPIAASAILLAMTPSLAAYRTIFLLSAVPGAVALALIAFGVRETGLRAPRAVGKTPLPGRFWVMLAVLTFASLTKINDALFLLRAGERGMPIAWIPAAFAGFTLVYALASYLIGVWSDRVGKRPLIAAGWCLLAAVEWGFSFPVGTLATTALFAGYGLFYALTEGSMRALIADLVPEGARGTAYAVFAVATGLALVAGGFGLGRLWEVVSPAAAFRLAALGSLCAGAALFALRRIKLV